MLKAAKTVAERRGMNPAPATQMDVPFLAAKLREAVTEGDDAYIFYAGKCREKIQLADVIILERAIQSPPPAPQEHVKTLVWEAHGEGFRGCGPIIYDIYPATEGGGWWAALSMAGYLPYRERLASPEAAKDAAQRDFEHRILDGFDNPPPETRERGL